MKKGILISVGVLLLFVILIVGGWGFRYYTAEIRGKIEAHEKVQFAEYRLFSYDHFYNLYSDIQAYEDQIKNQQSYIDSSTDEEEIKRYRRNVNALMNQRASCIRQYNADVRKEGTRGQFRSSDLPVKINIDRE